LSAQYVFALSNKSKSGANIAIEDYSYFEARYTFEARYESYLKLQAGSNHYHNAPDSKMIGARVGGVLSEKLGVELSFNKIDSNNYVTVNSSPMYTDWQQGYGGYEPSSAYGARVILYPVPKLKIKTGYMDVDAASGYHKDDYGEYIFYGRYTLNKISKIELLYSYKHQKAGSTRESRQDFRMIYYLNF
jgi:hypothetical protein